jgi:hypothetical protein
MEAAGTGAAEPGSGTHLEAHAIPVALLCCSPVIKRNSRSASPTL